MLEQVQAIDSRESKNQEQKKRLYTNIEFPEDTNEYQLSMTIYKQIEREKRKKILKQVEEIEKKYTNPFDVTNVGKFLCELSEIVKLADKEKVMFGMPYGLVHGMLSEEEKRKAVKEISLISHLIRSVALIKKENLNLEKNEQDMLDSLTSKISALISTGTYVNKEVLDLYRTSIPIDSSIEEKRNGYLLSLEKAVQNSIENGSKEGVIIERDNEFYCVKCPEGSVISPAKFMSSPEFKSLEYGALRVGEGDNVIRIHKGQYHDMKGRVTMSFKVGNEELTMILSSKKADEPENNALNFGTIMVYMDDRNCEIFSKHFHELEKVPRLERIVNRAKSFIKEKNGEKSEPFSVMEAVRAFKCSNCGHSLN
ncbi:hypothetical protein [Wolbachia endosymbiont of Tetranychus urticae]|uniref:hypothetical protein n=1 Tax=Wolbachia endosymbiont of Tetranychus urticae TaxID=169184 RepID=UPI00397C3A16